MPDAEAPGRVPRRTAQPIYSMKRVTKTEMVVESLTLRPEGQTLPELHAYLQEQMHRL